MTTKEAFMLETKPRTTIGSRAARRMRGAGEVPITLNLKTDKPLHLQVPTRQINKMIRTGARIVDIQHDGGKDKVFVKEVQLDHLGEEVYHVDFDKIAMDQTLELEVDLILKGKPVGLNEEDAALDQYVKTVEISCLPDAIPEKIEVNVEHLEVGQHLTLAEIKTPEGVKLLQDPELVLAGVNIHKEEEVTADTIEPGAAEPEVIKKETEEDPAEEGDKKE